MNKFFSVDLNFLPLFYFCVFKYRDGKEIASTFNVKMLQEGSVCTLKINKATKTMSGVYKCVATNSSGSKTSEATVTIEGWLKYIVYVLFHMEALFVQIRYTSISLWHNLNKILTIKIKYRL